ncbi:MAG TPA: trehalose-phosphatase [Geobacteraceae bacterium]|nr:trehalose-phosphatase [Geobacteraceae bacterium]
MNINAREKIWIFDFDGTLAPIVPERSKAELHPECRNMLNNLIRYPMNHVAVLSSRKLDDLTPRIPVDGLFLGGGSGTEWQVPGGHRFALTGEAAETLASRRNRLLPQIHALANLPGVDIEDKDWSVALHTRHAQESSRIELHKRLTIWQEDINVRIFRGPEVFEIQFFPHMSKSYGVRILCKFMKFAPKEGSLFYAGDDENDAVAMRLVIRLGGTAVTVGERPLIPASTVVKTQRELAEKVGILAALATG